MFIEEKLVVIPRSFNISAAPGGDGCSCLWMSMIYCIFHRDPVEVDHIIDCCDATHSC